MLTYKRKLILTKAQEQRIDNWIGACRWVYNASLEIRKEAWKNKQITPTVFDLILQLPTIKYIDWIADVPAHSLNDAVERLDHSYKKFFKDYKTGAVRPQFKSKKKYKSITLKQYNVNQKSPAIEVKNNKIKLPKISWIKFHKDSPITGKIKTATIVKELNGYFIYVVTDSVRDISNKDESQVIGLDMGIIHFYTDSNGNHTENPKHFDKYQNKLRIKQRSICRKKKGSNRYKKDAKAVGLIYRKIANARKDFLHKMSYSLSKKYNTIYVEDFDIKRMAKTKWLTRHILDCGWGMFRVMLDYKTNVIKVDSKYTSQTCNECNSVNSKNRISQSEFACTGCGHISNADVNASKNILSKGIALNRKRELIGCALVEESKNKDMSAGFDK